MANDTTTALRDHLRTLTRADLERAADAAAEAGDGEVWDAVLAEHARRDAEDERPTLAPPADDDDPAPLFVGGVVDAPTPLINLMHGGGSRIERVAMRAHEILMARGGCFRDALDQARAEVV